MDSMTESKYIVAFNGNLERFGNGSSFMNEEWSLALLI